LISILCETLFERQGMRNGDWDVAFINTDWVGLVHTSRAALDLAPLSDPIPGGLPDGWTPPSSDCSSSMKSFSDCRIDGPECLIYRTDLFEDPPRNETTGAGLVPLAVPFPGMNSTGWPGFSTGPKGTCTARPSRRASGRA
jgi:multiple sugar transport system substrate-binding protein